MVAHSASLTTAAQKPAKVLLSSCVTERSSGIRETDTLILILISILMPTSHIYYIYIYIEGRALYESLWAEWLKDCGMLLNKHGEI